MKRSLVVLLFAMALFGQDAKEVRNPRTSPADVAAGAKTFRSHCSPCHGMNGEGGRGPNLANGVFYRGSTDAALLNNIANGIPGTEMPGMFYNEDRIWQVVAHLRSLTGGAVPGGDTERGRRLFQAKGCEACHRVNGQGGRMGPDLSLIGQSRSSAHLRAAIDDPNADVRQRYWVVRCKDATGEERQGFLLNEDTYTVQFIDPKDQLQSLQKAELKDYRVEKVSKMPSYKGRLKDDELQDVVAYLSSLRPQGGAR